MGPSVSETKFLIILEVLIVYFQNTMSDRRIVYKREEDTYQCEVCQRKFSEVHFLSRHRREEHRPRVHGQHCSASFPRCRTLQLRRHKEPCQQQSYRPRGRIHREHESQGQSQSPEAMEAAGGLGAGLLSLKGMTSLRPQGISQLNQDPIPENMKAHRVIATKKLGRFHRLPPVKTPMIYQPPLNLVLISVITLFMMIMLLISSPSWTWRLLQPQVI